MESKQACKIGQKSGNERGKHDMGGDPAGSRTSWSIKSISDIKQLIQWLVAGVENRCRLCSISKEILQYTHAPVHHLYLVIGNLGLGRAAFSFFQ